MKPHEQKAQEAAKAAANDQVEAGLRDMEATGDRARVETLKVIEIHLADLEKLIDGMNEVPGHSVPIFLFLLSEKIQSTHTQLGLIAGRAVETLEGENHDEVS